MSNNRDRRNQREPQGQGNQPQPQAQQPASRPAPVQAASAQPVSPVSVIINNNTPAPVAPASAASAEKKDEKKKEEGSDPMRVLLLILAAAFIFCVGSWLTRGGLAAWGIHPDGQQPVVINNTACCGQQHTGAPVQHAQAAPEQSVVGYRVVAPASTDVVAQNVDGRQMTIPAGKSHTFSCGPNNPRLSIHFFAANGGRCLGQIDYRYNSGDGLRERFL